MLTEIKKAAKEVGITVIIAESDKNINDQLANIVRQESLPLALSSWDLKVDLEFDENGHLKNPTVDVTLLLIDKAEDLLRANLEAKAEEMGNLFIRFIRNLKRHLIENTNVKENPITGISFTYVPSFGNGKHSGVLSTFKIQMNLEC